MNEEFYFQRHESNAGWYWTFHKKGHLLTQSPGTFDAPEQLHSAVETVRAASAVLDGEPDKQFDGRRAANLVNNVQCSILKYGGQYEWVLKNDNKVLARSMSTYETESNALDAGNEFCTQAKMSQLRAYGGDPDNRGTPFDVGSTSIRSALRSLATLPVRGFRHRRTIQAVDTRIIVSGIRGKSSTTRRLGDIFNRRGYGTLTKITGNQPHLVRNGEVIPLNREGARTTLYENINVFRENARKLGSESSDSVAIFENQGITEYTTRLINRLFVSPDVILLTNVRRDHQDTLGETRADIARSFAKSVPSGTHVVCGEQHPVIYDYLESEVTSAGATIEQVTVPEEHTDLLGAETVHAVNHTLRAVDESPLPDEEIESYLTQIQPTWTLLPNGRVFNAAEVNDVESTEAVRRALPESDHVTPFVFLRADRRGRTASFVSYLNHLTEQGIVDKGYVMGQGSSVFASETDCHMAKFASDSEPSNVLQTLLQEGLPVMLMGNTVDEFMRDFEDEIQSLAKNTL